MVANQAGELVGHIIFTKIKLNEHTALALAPISVLPKEQGIGGKLIEKGHEIPKGLGYTLCVLSDTLPTLSTLWIYPCKQLWY